MNIETKEVIAPITKKVFTLKQFITGRDRRALTNILLGNMQADANGDLKGNFNVEAMDKASDLAWKTVIVMVDGKKEGELIEVKKADGTVESTPLSIVDAVLDLPTKDYTFIKNAVDEVTADKEFEEKKTN